MLFDQFDELDSKGTNDDLVYYALRKAYCQSVQQQFSLEAGGPYRFIVDKMPHNVLNLGLIARLFPDSPIIYCKRDIHDTAVSLLKRDFGAQAGGQMFGSLFNINRYYRDVHQPLMDHWHRVLPAGQILDVSYEQLVTNPQRHSSTSYN